MLHGSDHRTAQTIDKDRLLNSNKIFKKIVRKFTHKKQFIICRENSRKKQNDYKKAPDKMTQFQLFPCYIQQRKPGGDQYFATPEVLKHERETHICYITSLEQETKQKEEN